MQPFFEWREDALKMMDASEKTEELMSNVVQYKQQHKYEDLIRTYGEVRLIFLAFYSFNALSMLRKWSFVSSN